MKRSLLLLTVTTVSAFAACQLLLPERFAVNAPVRHMLWGRGVDAPAEDEVRERMRVPAGFGIGLFATEVPNARWLLPTRAGDLLVSLPRRGEVWLLERDGDGDGRSDGRRVLLADLERPHGLDFDGDWLYVGEGSAVGRVRFDADTSELAGAYARIVEGLPEGGNHWTRTVRIGPDQHLYVSVGSSCNVCEEEDERRAAVLRFRKDGSGAEVYARGLRNSVGFDWQPGTGALYATDNGRDLLGNDYPPCELNEVRAGGFYGWPYANGDNEPDPDFGEGRDAILKTAIAPAHSFRAHNAPLGIEFLTHPSTPAPYRDAALVALHGSWNRTTKDGYKVVSLHWNEAGEIEERDFATGFMVEDDVSGRPVDIAQGPDGSLYVSDDYAGAIWRVTYGHAVASPAAGSRATASIEASVVPATNPATLARGAALFEEHGCAECHIAARSRAGVVPVALRRLAQRYDGRALSALLKTPTPPMPVPALNDAERRDLAAHLLAAYGE